jgi:dihydrofolate synthase/folylpolyglutamate synthase
MKQSKDVAAFLRPLLPHAARLFAVAEPGQYGALPVATIVAASGGVAEPVARISEAMDRLTDMPPGRVLICGSLYLAGVVLVLDDAASPGVPAG